MNDPFSVQRQAWFRIACFPKFGPVRLRKIFETFNDPQKFLTEGVSTLCKSGIEDAILEEFAIAREDEHWRYQWERMTAENIAMTLFGESGYPELLSHIHQPPAVLFSKGALEQEWRTMISVVGTRSLSLYGKTVARPFVRTLAKNGIGIVSGLALGIDSEAHRGALDSSGSTAAVLAGGVDDESLFPSEHRTLAREIVERGGLLLSEHPPGTLPLRHYFPLRNRIIAGLTRGTLVIEADEHSGALITARYALEQEREVFAIPGPITSQTSTGTNMLIRLGAQCITNPQHIIESLALEDIRKTVSQVKTPPNDPVAKQVLEAIKDTAIDVDHVIRLSGLSTTVVQRTLADLELNGYVRVVGPGTYVKEM